MNSIIHKFIEDAGNMTQSFGLGRAVGQIYAYLYFSENPRNLADMQGALGISKGSASTNVRQLEQWGAVKKVWIKGDRKDYYEASDWFGKILKNALQDTVGKKMKSYANLLQEVEQIVEAVQKDQEVQGNGDETVSRRDAETAEKREKSASLTGSTLNDLNAKQNVEDFEFIRDRLEHMKVFQRRTQKIWSSPLLKKLLK
ncbi:hypothetical protein BVX94_00240 [bacterium B17]|nr:hypothetical protein BVX94_00240 [bacterium B17]